MRRVRCRYATMSPAVSPLPIARYTTSSGVHGDHVSGQRGSEWSFLPSAIAVDRDERVGACTVDEQSPVSERVCGAGLPLLRIAGGHAQRERPGLDVHLRDRCVRGGRCGRIIVGEAGQLDPVRCRALHDGAEHIARCESPTFGQAPPAPAPIGLELGDDGLLIGRETGICVHRRTNEAEQHNPAVRTW